MTATCLAPRTALRFAPDGRVAACCVNNQYSLGRIGADRIRDIWEGTRVAHLRAALDRADFSLGCTDCQPAHLAGHRLDTEAAAFDRHADEIGDWPCRLEFALSNRCNLQCVMCNGELSSAIRAQREHRPPLTDPYDDAFFAELAEFLPHATTTAFLGGEPFLHRAARRVWDLLIDLDHRPDVSVVTNATVWNAEVERYVAELGMDVTVSIDGVTAETFERIRVGARFDEVATIRRRLRDATVAAGSEFAINTCLVRENVHELGQLLVEAEQEGTPVSVILVTYPARHSVLDLEPAALREVVEHLRAEDDATSARLDRNLAEWRNTLRRLEARLDAVAQGAAPVAVRMPTRRPADRLAARIEELQSWSGRDPVVVEVVDDVVRSATSRDWAASLDLEAAVGGTLLRLLPDLAERLGVDPAVETVEREPGITEVAARLGDHGALRAFMAEWDDPDGRHVRLAIASRDELRAAAS